MSKKEFESLINSICINHNVTKQTISIAIGKKNEAYITELLSRKGYNTVPESVVRSVQLIYPLKNYSEPDQPPMIAGEPDLDFTDWRQLEIEGYVEDIYRILEKIKRINKLGRNDESASVQEDKKKNRRSA